MIDLRSRRSTSKDGPNRRPQRKSLINSSEQLILIKDKHIRDTLVDLRRDIQFSSLQLRAKVGSIIAQKAKAQQINNQKDRNEKNNSRSNADDEKNSSRIQ